MHPSKLIVDNVGKEGGGEVGYLVGRGVVYPRLVESGRIDGRKGCKSLHHSLLYPRPKPGDQTLSSVIEGEVQSLASQPKQGICSTTTIRLLGSSGGVDDGMDLRGVAVIGSVIPLIQHRSSMKGSAE